MCGLVCVQSLWAVWREEKSIFRSLHELSIVSKQNLIKKYFESLKIFALQNTGELPGEGGLQDSVLGLAGHHKLRSSFRYVDGPLLRLNIF